VSAVDAGRILNEKLARSQMIGGGWSWASEMTMLEETGLRPRGPVVSSMRPSAITWIPAHADVPDLDVAFVGRAGHGCGPSDQGLSGEIAVVGVSAAIANAVYHATGRRIRSLPITVEQLL